MTGPCVEINFMGYALPGQRGQGIHQRLRARSYIIEKNDKRVVFVSVDGGMASDLVKMKVIDYVQSALNNNELYTLENVAISGTHTHSGPAGYLQYVLFQVTSLGFVEETFNAWVIGIGESILNAHMNLESSNIYVNSGKLYGANINRSPSSYLLNPEVERDFYKDDGDTDKTMLLLKFVNKENSKLKGVLNWFAVHGTSMNNTNTLVSGDNRGYASYLLERFVNGEPSEVQTGLGSFVAAFASTNLGDVSPNTAGPKCIDTGLDCDGTKSTCDGKCEKCIAFGPGTNGDMFESTQIIGNKQFEFAKELMNNADELIDDSDDIGIIDYRHSFVDMSSLNVTIEINGEKVTKTLCSAAMGYSFAAGTTDGPGMFNFTQGTTSGNEFWDKVRDFLSEPTNEEVECHSPKPILFNTGDLNFPYAWDPHVVPIQVQRIGNFFILSVPTELTTMAGRRLRTHIKSLIRQLNVIPESEEIYVTIAGLANSYASYVTTYEEYQAQRYEAASTLYGPYTLAGYIQEFSRIVTDLLLNQVSSTEEPPEDLTEYQIQLMPEPIADKVPSGYSFGDIVPGYDVNDTYYTGNSVVVKFFSANPRNNFRVQGTYLSIQKLKKIGVGYDTIATDSDWETKFFWLGGKEDPIDVAFAPFSKATITWDIPATTAEGTYRICHYGDHRNAITETNIPFTGCSSDFKVLSSE